MKKFLVYILILTALVGTMIFTPTATAQETLGDCKGSGQIIPDISKADCESKGDGWVWQSYYYLLSPLPCPKNDPNCVDQDNLNIYKPSQDSQLSGYLNILIKIFIGICSVLAVIMIIVGGLEYMTTELVSTKESAKSRITNAIFGLILALGAWTILYQINPRLLDADLKNLKVAEVTVDLEADVPQTAVNGKYSDGTTVGTNWETKSGVARTDLPSGVSVNSGECVTVGQRNCTSLRGLTGQYINKIRAGCPTCQLTITGGTEFWLHGGKTGSTSHKPGNPTVDLRVTPELTRYIMGDKKPQYFRRYEKDGMSFLYEGNHWHVGP